MRRLLGELGFSGNGTRFIHVAGTNGKGSVCAMIDSICRAEGIRSGLYTSPHLVTYRERIRLCGEMISEEQTANGLTKIARIIEGWEPHPTFFEITTALAFDVFGQEQAEVVALETGLGGRLDATNVLEGNGAALPAACVITSIDIDHQALLGRTIGQIAGEKAGIIKPGVPVVSAPQKQEAAAVLVQTALDKKSSLEFISAPIEKYPVGLAGSHQKLNAALSVAALRAAGIKVSEESIRNGLLTVSWPGRFQIINHPCVKNTLVIDGAHNEAAALRLMETWREVFGDEKAVLILGVLKDKDVTAVCRALVAVASGCIVIPVRSPRASAPEELIAIIRQLAPELDCKTARGFTEALETAAASPGKILVAGSLFLAGEALAFFDGHDIPEMSLQ